MSSRLYGWGLRGTLKLSYIYFWCFGDPVVVPPVFSSAFAPLQPFLPRAGCGRAVVSHLDAGAHSCDFGSFLLTFAGRVLRGCVRLALWVLILLAVLGSPPSCRAWAVQ